MARHLDRIDKGILLLLLFTALILGILLGGMTFDDPFVTYRYARNLRNGLGLVYNQGESVLSTTAPLYAVLLAAGTWLTADLPLLSNTLGVAAMLIGAICLYLLCRNSGMRLAGVVASLLYLTAPLLWLSLGFETALYLALVLAAFHSYDTRRLSRTAVFLALALMIRNDGIIPIVVVGLHYVVSRRSLPWRSMAIGVGLAGPWFLYLTMLFGTPLPITLAAKAAQARLGVTGFYAHTTFLQGAAILARGYFDQSWLYVTLVAALILGILSTRQQPRLWPIIAWALLYAAGYVALGVAPYHWYYAPLIPALVVVAGVGAQTLAIRVPSPRSRLILSIAVVMILVLPQLVSNAHIGQALRQPGAVPPDAVEYKVLPEAKVNVYRRVGEWLNQETPPDATVGVTEVGVIGYYAQRTMVDFLGLLRPAVIEALRAGHMHWALFHYQPDYVVLTRVNPLYSYDLRQDQWFSAAYQPVRVFEDFTFWGGPVTIYQRQMPRYETESATVPANAVPVHIVLAGEIELTAYTVDQNELHPGDVLNLTLYWTCLATPAEDYTVFVHLLGQHDLVVAQHDAPPCLSTCPTRGWQAGDLISDPHMLALPVTTFTPDQVILEIGLYEPLTMRRLLVTSPDLWAGHDQVRFHPLAITPASFSLPNATAVNFGGRIALVGYDVTDRRVSPGQSLGLTLYWRALQPMSENWSVFAHLLDERGERIAQHDGWPQQGQAPTSSWLVDALVADQLTLSVPESAPLGAYSVQIGLYLAETQERLTLLDAAGQPKSDHLVLTRLRVAE